MPTGRSRPTPYYRVFAVDTLEANAARREARIRCGATEVAIGGQAFDNPLIEDDFNSLDWAEVDGEVFELGYHPDNFHLDVRRPAQRRDRW